MNQKKTTREIIIESSVIISSLIIFFGFLKQYWYYAVFGIKIQQFLSLDEVLILFFGEVPFIIKLLSWAILYYLLIFFLIKMYCYFKDRKNNNSNETEDKIKTTLDDFVDDKANLKIIFAISIIGNVGLIYAFNYFHSELSIIFLTLMSCQSVLVLLDIIDIGIEDILKNTTIIICGLSIMLYCKNIIDIEYVFKEHKKVEFSLIEKGKNIKTSKNLLFIGKTKNYIFLFDNFKKETKIIKTENINQFKISLN
ncbi:hypothetical protein L1S35_06555 [Flavobacterium sp. AS60]|uniref:hypothetical protein n=1 Tax=Flavobacterium anseongense TaxID=2910677 RepID=UPI001F3758D6|nr:hypothetical protein [Flavobacterium sp. AS60]MCF6129327.1 hypothetical protein [Flavobacterium sp. AS60]